MEIAREPATAQWQRLHAAWLTHLDSDGSLDLRVADCLADLAETVIDRPSSTPAAMRRIGATLGSDGWPLETIYEWLMSCARLRACKRRAARRISSRVAIAQLAEGWVAENIRVETRAATVDATTGLVTEVVLAARVRELQARNRRFNVEPGMGYQAILIDSNIDHVPPLDRSVVLVTVAALCRDLFHAGETIARCGSRVVIIAADNDDNAARVVRLQTTLRQSPVVSTVDPTVWVDRLPGSDHEIDRWIIDVAA